MGDLRSEYRLVKPMLQHAGCRVVTMDVRGFGESSPSGRTTLRERSAVTPSPSSNSWLPVQPQSWGNSFAAGSALWAAKESPGLVNGVLLRIGVAIFPKTIQKLVLLLGFIGPWRTWFWTPRTGAAFSDEAGTGSC